MLTVEGIGHAGRVYELTGPEAPTYLEVAQALTEVLDGPVRYVSTGPVGHWR